MRDQISRTIIVLVLKFYQVKNVSILPGKNRETTFGRKGNSELLELNLILHLLKKKKK